MKHVDCDDLVVVVVVVIVDIELFNNNGVSSFDESYGTNGCS